MTMGQPTAFALALGIPGLLSFIFAVIAENKKPDDSSATAGLSYDAATDKSTCPYPKDPTILLGILAAVLLFISAVISLVAFYFPYNGKKIPIRILWRSKSVVVFTIISLMVFLVGESLLLWGIIVEHNHHEHNVHKGRLTECPTAKSGLFGGASFLALDATLFFLIVLMLTINVRSEYLSNEEAGVKGSYGVVTVSSSGGSSPDRVNAQL